MPAPEKAEKRGNGEFYPKRANFAKLLIWHLENGTRPAGSPETPCEIWSTAGFAEALDVDPRNVRYWRTGTMPSELGPIETALFGSNKAYREWRQDLRAAFKLGALAGHLEAPCATFTGREDEVEKIVAALLDSDSGAALLVGPPGVGKSELTKVVAQAPEIVERFGPDWRWFIRLDAAKDGAAMRDLIARAIDPSPGFTFKEALARLKLAKGLLILDNLETPWSPRDARADVEAALGELAKIPGLGLLASFRGREQVGGAPWALVHPVDTLEPPRDGELFNRVAARDLAGDPDLPRFLAALGGLPLAIDLVARRAHMQESLAALWWQWEKIGADLIDDAEYANDRTKSLRFSLELSLGSPRMTEAAKRLFAFLGASPAGVAEEERDHWLGRESYNAAEALLKLGLAQTRAGRLDLLPPIREYARRARPLAPEDAEAWRRRYLDLAREIGRALGTEAGFGGMARLTPEFANLSAALAACAPGRLAEARAAVHGFGRFAYLGARPAPILAELAGAFAAASDKPAEALCLRVIGDIALARSQHEDARKAYEKAIPLYQNVGDVLGQANCIKSLGDIALARSQHDDARKTYEKAIPLYQNVGDVLGEANCIQSLGHIALERSQHEDARKAYEKAIPLYQNVGDVLGEAVCIACLGDIALERSQHDDARKAYEKAIPLFQNVGDVLGQASCIQSLGDVALRRSQRDEARKAYEKAIPLYRNIGAVIGEANCIARLGDIALRRSQRDEARKAYEKAIPLYRNIGAVIGEANCIARLGDIALERSQHDDARRAYEKALPMHRHVGNLLGEGACLIGLGDVARALGDKAAARDGYAQALPLFERFGDPVSVGICRERIASVAETRGSGGRAGG